jgi:hypothetical protein
MASLDPGQKHVGLALWLNDELLSAGEITPAQTLPRLMEFNPDIVVVESFSLMSPRYAREKAKQAVDTILLIGKVQGMAELHGSMTVVLQQPSVRHIAQRSPFWTDLQRNYDVPANSHARSAVAHGLYWLRFKR